MRDTQRTIPKWRRTSLAALELVGLILTVFFVLLTAVELALVLKAPNSVVVLVAGILLAIVLTLIFAIRMLDWNRSPKSKCQSEPFHEQRTNTKNYDSTRRAMGIRHWVTLGAIIAVLVIAILAVWKVPEWQVPSGVSAEKGAELENEFRKTTAQIEAGIGIFLGLVFTGIGVYFAGQRARAMETAVEVSGESQITERFTRAIDQLGSTEVAIRLGGIYALERIAKDSPDKDHWQVMEVLSAYVRESSRWSASVEQSENDRLESWIQSRNAPGNVREQLVNEWRLETEIPRVDIQAILSVLGRRIRTYETDVQWIDLGSTNLRRYSLIGNLDGVRFDQSNLRGADLNQISLNGASFNKALLDDAQIQDANLNHSFWDGASLTSCWFTGSDFRGSDLGRANLSGSRLSMTDLRGSNFENTILDGANLFQADLRESKWLTQEQIDSAETNAGTLLPDGLMSTQR